MNKKVILSIICSIMLLGFATGCTDNKLVKLDEEFRQYLINNYNVELAEKATVSRCHNNCDYFGYYPLKNDLTYVIQISKTKDSYKVSYDNKAVAMRKELYNYILSQKGDNYVDSYLAFYDNGDHGHISSSSITRSQLKYIVCYDSGIDMDEQIYKDYLILKKASYILSSNTNSRIMEMEVYYINDQRLRKKDWLENLNIEVDDYTFAPSYLDNDNELSTDKFTYHYRISDYRNNMDLGSLVFDEFKKMVNKNLEVK